MAEENQQMMMQPQSAVPQSVAGTITVSSNVDLNSQHNVSTSMTMASAGLNASQAQSVANVQAAVNTSSGTPVHMTIPPPPQTPAPTAVIPQSSGHHQAMIQPISSIPQNQIPQVQVIQQPLSASYLPQLYTPQQQMLFPGNLTLQPAGMTAQTIQGLGATQGLSLQLQTKTAVDPKTSVSGTTLQAVNQANKNEEIQVTTGDSCQSRCLCSFHAPRPSTQSSNNNTWLAISLGSSNMMTATGQVIGSGAKSCLTPQMFNQAKSSAVLHNQQGFSPATSNQTVVIGQLGVLPSQQSVFPNHKTLVDTQKGKTYMVNQQTALQPKSPIYPSSASIPTSGQVLNGNQLKQLSQPQIITSQPTTMFTQAQILGSFQALGASLPPGITWATTPGCLQSPALLAQNPIFIRSQQSDMFIQSPPPTAVHLPVAQASAPLPPTTFATATVAQRPKQVRPASSVATQTAVSSAVASQPQAATPVRAQAKAKSRTISSHLTPVSVAHTAPQMATTQTQTQQQPSPQPMAHAHPTHPAPAQQQQRTTDAANQTKPTPEMKSIATQSKTVGTETNKQQPLLVEKSQNIVAPVPKTAEVATVTPVQPTPPVPVMPVISTSTSTVSTVTDATTTTTSTPQPQLVSLQPNTLLDVAIDDASVTVQDFPDPSPPSPAPPETPVCAPRVEDSVPDTEHKLMKPDEPLMGLKPVSHMFKDKQPQKAIVKPQILTHVIDGYIIQEGPEPFPVSRSSLLTESITPKVPPKDKKEKPANTPGVAKVRPSEGKQKIHKPRHPIELAKCEFCEKLGAKSKFKKSKRFCSKSCAKRYNVSCSKRQGRLSTSQNVVATGKVGKKKIGFKPRKGWRKSQSPPLHDYAESGTAEESQEDSSTPMEEVSQNEEMENMDENGKLSTDAPSEPETISPLANIKEEMEVVDVAESVCTSNTPLKWTVQDVWDFVRSLPGCSDYADEFRSQEIDGQALLLLKEDHLISAMSMKLGPALKLIAKINDIKEITNS